MFFPCSRLPRFDNLPFIEAVEPSLLDSRDMDKHISSADAVE